ncbi:MAG: ClpXP protease specificity-enhancing factor [Neisseria sp.]|nr:ClpXP protease specificity-enhancing factor [Neisseria sp.]
MSSTKPYFIRALYEWCADNGYTPYLEVWVNSQTRVPMQYVKDERIVLNIGATAANRLHIDNDWIHFAARFSGVSHDIWIPVGHVMSIFARETGEGMGFEVEPLEDAAEMLSENAADSQHSDETPETAKQEQTEKSKKKVLKFVKPE